MIYSRVRVKNSDGTLQPPLWVDFDGNPPMIMCDFNTIMRDLVTGPYVGMLAKEFSVPNAPQIGQGKLLSSAVLDLPVTVSAEGLIYVAKYQEIEAMIDAAITAGRLPLPNANSLYGVFAPNFRVQDSQGFVVGVSSGGYHTTFKSKTGNSVAYFVVDASDAAQSNTILYASHELAEAITDTESTGWHNEDGQEIADICQVDDADKRASYHDWDISKVFLPSTGLCTAPPDDAPFPAVAQFSIVPGTVESTLGCAISISVNTSVSFTIAASVNGVAVTLTNIQWVAQDGSSIIGSGTNAVCKIMTPPNPGPFQLVVSGVDEFGCGFLTEQSFDCVSAATVALEGRLCAIKHIILKNWRLLNPIWSSSRNLSKVPGTEVEIRAIESLVDALTEFKESLAKVGNR
jgi:hypothetical protein